MLRLSPYLVILLVVVFGIAGPSKAYAQVLDDNTGERNQLGRSLVEHSPIVILSDSDFQKPPDVSGVVSGSGVPGDPYVIEGWRIDASTADVAGIWVAHTTANFVIRNVWVENGFPYKSGVVLTDVKAGAVLNSKVTHADTGISVGYSPSPDHALGKGILLRGNILTGNSLGIGFYGSSGGVAQGNVLRHNTVGISFVSNRLTIIENKIFHTSTIHVGAGAISGFTSGSIIENNRIVSGTIGISLQNDSLGNRIRGNVIIDHLVGIELVETHRNNVTSNVILDTELGIFLVTLSHGNLISRNTIRGSSWYAMFVHGTAGAPNLFLENEIKDSDRGIWILNSHNSVVEGNKIVGSRYPIGLFCMLPHELALNVLGENILVDVGVPSIVRWDVCFNFFPPPPLWPLSALAIFSTSNLQLSTALSLQLLDPETRQSVDGFDWGAALAGTTLGQHVIVRNVADLPVMVTITHNLVGVYGRILILNPFTASLREAQSFTLQPNQERRIVFLWKVAPDAPEEPVTFDIFFS